MNGIVSRLVVDRETGASKGYGFIIGADGHERFVHRSELSPTDWSNLRVGDPVTFEPVDHNPKGLRAERVQPRSAART